MIDWRKQILQQITAQYFANWLHLYTLDMCFANWTTMHLAQDSCTYT